MDIPPDEIDELKALFKTVMEAVEAGVKYFLLSDSRLPSGCRPDRCDLLLCPIPRDGYPSRLFFSAQVTSTSQRSWAKHRILERDWFVCSWKDGGQSRLAQMVIAHLEAVK